MKKLLLAFAVSFTLITSGLTAKYYIDQVKTPVVTSSTLSLLPTTYYISATGNDGTGTGSVGAPWRSLNKATSVVTTSGDIIHVNAGTYPETLQSVLAPGVSIEGDGITSVITSTVGGNSDEFSWVPTINAVSTSLQTAAAHISNLKMDGGMASEWAIEIGYRNNFSIYNCTIVNFYNFGVSFINEGDPFIVNTPPQHGYRTGNTFHDNILVNCANYNNWGRGCLNIGGQEGMLVYNNTITQDSRALRKNGWPIKYSGDGFTRGLKIYNNIITKNPLTVATGDGDWSFAMELFNGTGTEIYNNTIQGSLDFNFQGKRDTYPWVLNVHDNIINNPSVTGYTREGIVMEYSVDGMIIENNVFNKQSHVFCFFPRDSAVIRDVYIRGNLCNNIGCTSTYPRAIFGFDAPRGQVHNFNILNNTFSCDTITGHNSDVLMNFTGNGTYIYDSLNIRNNIFKGYFQYLWYLEDVTKFTHTTVTNNDLVPIGGGNSTVMTPPWSTGITGYPGTMTIVNNIALEPQFFAPGNYTLKSTSPVIDAGTYVGKAYSGSAPDMGYSEFIVGGNVAPTSYAGIDQTITLPTSTITLSGVGTDVDGLITAYQWTKLSGPISGTITNATLATTTVTGLTAGTYIYDLKVTDDSLTNNTGHSTVTIVVNVFGFNVAPVAIAGTDQVITLPVNAKLLIGSGTDADGTVVSYSWREISGLPNVFVDSLNAICSVRALVTGTYSFELTVIDNLGSSGKDTVQLYVAPYSGSTVGAFAGLDQNITTSTSNLYGVGAVPSASGTNKFLYSEDFSNVVYDKGSVTIIPNQALDLTGNMTLSSIDATWTSSGLDQAINVTPGTTYYLSFDIKRGTATDIGYAIVDYSGGFYNGFITGGSTVSIYSATSGTVQRLEYPVVIPAGITRILVNFNNGIPVLGSYYMGRMGFSTVAHDAYAKTTTTAAVGSVGGTIASYGWVKLTGTGTITSPSSVTTGLTGLLGISTYQLTVTNGLGATAKDTVQVSVGAVNIAPTVNAGIDQVITLPTSSVSVTGVGTDVDGTISTHSWSKQSGPGTFTITSPSSTTTTITGLVQGTYVFRDLVTDNLGATGFDDVQITVNPLVDVTAPLISSTNPTNGATGVLVNSNILITFNEPLNGGTVTTTSVNIAGVTSVVTYSSNTITIDPTANLAYSTTYTVNITSVITDVAGNHFVTTTKTFTTAAAPVTPIGRWRFKAFQRMKD